MSKPTVTHDERIAREWVTGARPIATYIRRTATLHEDLASIASTRVDSIRIHLRDGYTDSPVVTLDLAEAVALHKQLAAAITAVDLDLARQDGGEQA